MLCLLLLTAPGCARLPVSGALSQRVAVAPLTTVAAGFPFACEPNGPAVAYVNNGLRVIAAGDGEGRVIDPGEPYLLAWSPDGERLAVAADSDGGTLLRLFAATGVLLGETRVADRVTDLGWSPTAVLLATAANLELFSFGGHLRQILYRWNGTEKATAITLAEVSLMPATVQRWGKVLPGLLHLAVSPWGEALVYTRFHDPPAYSPYLKVILRHLGSGLEEELARVSLGSGGALFTANGAGVLYGDGDAASSITDPWGGAEVASFPVAGHTLASSPGGASLLIDGHLFRDGKELATFPTVEDGCFVRQGTELIVRSGTRLYRVAGLSPDDVPALDPGERRRLELLRRWRSEGLITADDYRRSAAKGERQ
ncbi:MAG TPA: hypothetical protein VIU40_01040 [Geobacteraceae bacterium]